MNGEEIHPHQDSVEEVDEAHDRLLELRRHTLEKTAEGHRVWLVVSQDRHSDPDYFLTATRAQALEKAEEFVQSALHHYNVVRDGSDGALDEVEGEIFSYRLEDCFTVSVRGVTLHGL